MPEGSYRQTGRHLSVLLSITPGEANVPPLKGSRKVTQMNGQSEGLPVRIRGCSYILPAPMTKDQEKTKASWQMSVQLENDKDSVATTQ